MIRGDGFRSAHAPSPSTYRSLRPFVPSLARQEIQAALQGNAGTEANNHRGWYHKRPDAAVASSGQIRPFFSIILSVIGDTAWRSYGDR